MTMNRTYAAVALILAAALPITGCSQASSPRKPPTSAASSPTPPAPLRITSDDARLLAVLGQRGAGDFYPGAPDKEPAEGETCGRPFSTPKDATWSSGAGVSSKNSTKEEIAKAQVGRTFSAVAVLPDLTAETALDALIEEWSANCPDAEGAYAPTSVSLPHADAYVVLGSQRPKASISSRHVALGVARIGNAELVCRTDSKTAQTSTTETTACLTDLIGGVLALARPEPRGTDIGAKVLLAGVVGVSTPRYAVTFADHPLRTGRPC